MLSPKEMVNILISTRHFPALPSLFSIVVGNMSEAASVFLLGDNERVAKALKYLG